jgi:hypothetical protein
VAWLDGRARDGGIDEVPLPSGPGRLWLCGKHAVGPDPDAVLERLGATTIVCLNEDDELRGRYPGYVAWLQASAPERAVWFPIPDLHAPDLDALRRLVEALRLRVAAGEGLLLHCGAGIGRAGTVAAALLVTMGEGLDDALAHLLACRPTAGPQTAIQEDLLARFAAGD